MQAKTIAQNQLVAALLKGDLLLVKQLESQKEVSFSYPDKEGLYPLVAAIYSMNLELVHYVEKKLKSEEDLKQWEKVDAMRVKEKIEVVKPIELTGNTVGDLGRWYGRHKGSVWEWVYNAECLKMEGYNCWADGYILMQDRAERLEREYGSMELRDCKGGGMGRAMDRIHVLYWPSAITHSKVAKLIVSQLEELREEVNTKAKQLPTQTLTLG